MIAIGLVNSFCRVPPGAVMRKMHLVLAILVGAIVFGFEAPGQGASEATRGENTTSRSTSKETKSEPDSKNSTSRSRGRAGGFGELFEDWDRMNRTETVQEKTCREQEDKIFAECGGNCSSQNTGRAWSANGAVGILQNLGIPGASGFQQITEQLFGAIRRGSFSNCPQTCAYVSARCDGETRRGFQDAVRQCVDLQRDRNRSLEDYQEACAELGLADCRQSILGCQAFLSQLARDGMDANQISGNVFLAYERACPHLACAAKEDQAKIREDLASELQNVQKDFQETQSDFVKQVIEDDKAMAQTRMDFLENEAAMHQTVIKLEQDLATANKTERTAINSINRQLNKNRQEIRQKIGNANCEPPIDGSAAMGCLQGEMISGQGSETAAIMNDYQTAIESVENGCREVALKTLEAEKQEAKERVRKGEQMSHVYLQRLAQSASFSEFAVFKDPQRNREFIRCMRGRDAWFKIQAAARKKYLAQIQLRSDVQALVEEKKALLDDLDILRTNSGDQRRLLTEQGDLDMKKLQALRNERATRANSESQIAIMRRSNLQNKSNLQAAQIEQIRLSLQQSCARVPGADCAVLLSSAGVNSAVAKAGATAGTACAGGGKEASQNFSKMAARSEKLQNATREFSSQCCSLFGDSRANPSQNPSMTGIGLTCIRLQGEANQLRLPAGSGGTR